MSIDTGANAKNDQTVRDHLSGSEPLDLNGYTDVRAPRKDRKQEFLDQGYVVLASNDQEDSIIVAKKVKKEKKNGKDSQEPEEKEGRVKDAV